jgi:predicted Zn-dependent protease
MTQVFNSLWQTLSGWLVALGNYAKQNPKTSVITVALIIATVAGYNNYAKQYTPLLNQAQSNLNIGLYSEAKAGFQKAIDAHPIRRLASLANIIKPEAGQAVQESLNIFDFSHEAELGFKKASLAETMSQLKSDDREQQLKQLADENPNDADIQVLLGKLSLSYLDKEEAESYYLNAIALNSNIAEAHFGLCAIYELDGKITDAVKECEEAVRLSGIKPTNYVINLAGLYLQQEKYKQALHLIAKRDSRYLNVKFELARIYLFTGQLTQAIDFETQVLASLNDVEKMKQPENQTIWYYKSDFENVLLKTANEKKCYVTYTLALTAFLKKERRETEKHIKATVEPCKQAGKHSRENIKNIVRYDLDIATKNSALSKQAAEFKKKYLK